MASFFEWFGITIFYYIVIRLSYIALKQLYIDVIRPMLGLTINFKKYGKWAVVTGSTDGIGKAYAHEFARRGMDVVLISRTPYKLQNVAAEIEDKYGVKTRVIAVDFTGGVEIYETIREGLEGLEIGVLVNNVAMSYAYPELFTEIEDTEKLIQNMVNCNILSVSMMTSLVLPYMLKKKKGVILNISSNAAMFPLPMLTLYSATKSFVTLFTGGLNEEYKNQGLIIQAVQPGFVCTNMSKIKKQSFYSPSPEQYVASQLRTVGVESLTAGFLPHKIQAMGQVLGVFFGKFLYHRMIFSMMNSMRIRGIKKKAREQKQA